MDVNFSLILTPERGTLFPSGVLWDPDRLALAPWPDSSEPGSLSLQPLRMSPVLLPTLSWEPRRPHLRAEGAGSPAPLSHGLSVRLLRSPSPRKSPRTAAASGAPRGPGHGSAARTARGCAQYLLPSGARGPGPGVFIPGRDTSRSSRRPAGRGPAPSLSPR